MSPHLPPPDRQNSSSHPADAVDFDQSIQELEQALQALKDRYAQVQSDQLRRQDLQQQLRQTQQASSRNRASKALQTELKRIRQQLEEVEIALESQLFSWSGLRERFWQILRFGGAGVVIGWVLRSWSG